MSNFCDQLKVNIQSLAAIVQVISHETLRIRAYCIQTAEELQRDLYLWNGCEGLKRYNPSDKQFEDFEDIGQPFEILDWINDTSKNNDSLKRIILLEDFHHYFHEHTLISRLRSYTVAVASRQIEGISLVLSQPMEMLPIELEKEVQVMQLPFPSSDDLVKLMRQAKQRFELDDRDYQEIPALVESALGLSTSEAQLAFSKVAYQFKRLTELQIPEVVKEKEQVIRKSGHLEYFHPKATLEDIGGL